MNYFRLLFIHLLLFGFMQAQASIPIDIPNELGDPEATACTVTTGPCSITIDYLSPNDYSKVFNSNWQIVWQCNPWENGGCTGLETITDLENGTYYVQACGVTESYTISGCGQGDPCANQGGDSDGDGVCDSQDCQPYNYDYPAPAGSTCNDGNANTTNDVVTADGCGCAGTPVTPPGGCNVSSDGCDITIAGLDGSEYVKVFDATWSIVWQCNPWQNGGCNATEIVTGLSNGLYNVQACGTTSHYTIDCGGGGTLPSLTIGDATADEEDGTATLTITASAPAASPITVTYTTSNGTALAGTDYTPTTATATIPTGQTSTTISITLVDDNTSEPTEEFMVFLSNPNGATIADNLGKITVNDGDVAGALPTLTIGDATADEDDGTATVTITASAPATSPITVTYTTNDGTALAGTDYSPTTATATIPTGQTSTTISIPLTNDNTPESTEEFTVVLSNPNGATIADNSGTITVTDGDVVNPPVGCNVSSDGCDLTITGLDGTEYIKVFDANWSIVWQCNPWQNGGCSATEIVTGLSNGLYNVQACGTTSPYTIDCGGGALPSLTIGDATADENDGTATVTITASAPATSPITVTYTTNNGTALAGTDYSPTTATATIPTGQTSTTISIPLTNDNTPESTEEFTVVLSNPNGATIADNSGTITVTDGDVAGALPTLTIGDATADEDDGTATVTITASAPATSPITVTYTTNNGTALAGTDYSPTTATATIPAGQTSTTISIPLTNDNTPEPTENFTVVLSNPNGATIADNSGTITVTDGDVVNPPVGCNVSSDGCDLTITGLDGTEYIKVFDANWSIVWQCNPWQNGGCNATEIVTGLSNGLYNVQACGTTSPYTIDCGVGALPSLTIGDATADEDDGTATVTITASAPATSPITVTYTTNNGTALAGTDYSPTTATATIPTGQTSTTISIPLTNDNTPEPTEEFTVVLSNPNGATIADNSGTVTVTDGDVTAVDTDGDGIADVDDLDDDNDGITDVVENLTAPANGDTDGDGTPDQLDLDSDNDGINDVVEAGGIDTNDDGIADGIVGILPMTNGIPATAGTGLVPPNTDNDGKPDFQDLDSDNDTISDLVESGAGAPDSDDNGVVDGPDTDGDGILDPVDGMPAMFADANDPTAVDTDGEGTPDFLDPDSDDPTDNVVDATDGDNDDIDDAGNSPLDADMDGLVDNPTDSDNDGIADVVDEDLPGFGGLGAPLGPDTDGDGIADVDDLDDDNDGITDVVENLTAPANGDTDGDGTPDQLDLDSDNDGINDVVEAGGIDNNDDGIADGVVGILPMTNGIPATAGTGLMPPNTDNDGKPDFQDLDSDNDTISDLVESGSGAPDVDDNGVVDGPDTDGDGILDPVDGMPGMFADANDPAAVDTDGEGTPDFLDPDSDDPTDNVVDATDGNNDDIDDAGNSPLDADMDGLVDNPADDDNDGIADIVDEDLPGFGGLPAPIAPDNDGDGIADVDDLDDDNDGITDVVENLTAAANGDTDGDGTPDQFDLDSDNDGITDVEEAGGLDANNDGIADGLVNADGIPASAGNGIDPINTDNDAFPDFQDLDSDNDGITDALETQTAPANGDTDGDGVIDRLDLDSDNDGINDVVEAGGTDANFDGIADGAVGSLPNTNGIPATAVTGLVAPDTDNDGQPDFQDLDSDNDTISDLVESGANALDANDDGVVDGPDTDGDGILDEVDGAPAAFADANDPVALDTDGEGTPDFLDPDRDDPNDNIVGATDGINDDVDEAGNSALDADENGLVDNAADADFDGIADVADDNVPAFGGLAVPLFAPDADNDGVADAEDCQPFNPAIPAIPGTPCDDGMANTFNDVIASDGCGCAGQINVPICNFIIYDETGFENGYGPLWNDGGHSSTREYGKGANGSLWAVELKDNDGSASSTFTNNLNLFNISKVRFDFMVRFESMEHGEDLLLEYSTNGGSNFQVAHQWISGTHINNSHVFANIVVEINNNFSSQTVFRFRCDASSGFDKVYLDDIKFSTCVEYNDPYAGQRPTYRSIDGTLNNFDNPEYGKRGCILAREIPAQYGDGVGSLAGPNRPSPRHISNILSDEPLDRRDERLLSGMAYQFGQFLDHDIVNSSGGAEFAPISIPSYDPLFSSNNVIPFTRSPRAPGFNTREQSNNLSSYIDASQVYGVDPVRAAWLRSFEDGKLKVSSGNQLPYNTVDGEYDSPTTFDAPEMERNIDQAGNLRTLAVAGDIRANEHPNLSAFHLIFVREHNRLCDMFVSQGETDDEIIYQKARKLVGAMIQRIVYKEFLPAMGVSLSNYTGYKSNVRPDVLNTFATAAYRWHTMVENDIILRNDNCEGIGAVELPLKSIFANPEIIRQYGPGVLLRGLAFHPQYRTDLKVNNGLRNFLFGPGAGLDLVSINLQRGRDHGLPDYKTVRNFYGGGNVSSFSDINSDHEISSRLQLAYGDVNDIDLWAGIFAEPLVPGTSLPATAIAIIKRQFEVLRDGDFYYYENDPFLTSSDRNIIEGSGLADIIERNTSARSMPDNIFFKPPCDEIEALEDTRDELHPVCNTHGATFITSCSGSTGTDHNEGTFFNNSNIRKINVHLGFSVRITNVQGESTYYTDDTGCLPAEFSGNNISSIQVICLSKDPSTIDCTGFAGALFGSCGGSPLPIFTTGSYNTEQLKSLAVANDDVEALRVNNGFKVILYEHDNFQGASWEYVGPTVLCLPHHQKNKVSSMKAICLSDPDRSNCGFNGVAGAVFLHTSLDPANPNPNDHIGASVGAGDYTEARLQQMNIPNDGIKKIAVNNGYAITLFEHDNFGGNYTVYMGDESDLSTTITETHYPIWDLLGLFPYTNTSTMHLKSSSMKVRCIESMQSNLESTSTLDLFAKKEGDRAKLDVSYVFAEEVTFIRIEKFDGRTGEFEVLHDFTIDNNEGIYTYYDDETKAGDNVYRAKVFYASNVEAETAYRTVRFDFENFHLYPNPATDMVTLNMAKYIGQEVSVAIYDMLGNQVIAQSFDQLSQTEVAFDISNVSEGSYVVRVVANGDKSVAKKLIVVKNY